jgi:hypothetical protein
MMQCTQEISMCASPALHSASNNQISISCWGMTRQCFAACCWEPPICFNDSLLRSLPYGCCCCCCCAKYNNVGTICVHLPGEVAAWGTELPCSFLRPSAAPDEGAKKGGCAAASSCTPATAASKLWPAAGWLSASRQQHVAASARETQWLKAPHQVQKAMRKGRRGDCCPSPLAQRPTATPRTGVPP